MRFKFYLTFILAACAPHLKLGHTLDYERLDNSVIYPEDRVRFSFVCLVVIIDEFCTGTIVASKAVLTSKRCLFSNKDYRNYQNYRNRVHAGVYGNSAQRNYTQTMEVHLLLPYNWDSDSSKFDIMLVVLKEPFKWDKATQPYILSDTVTFPEDKSESCLLVGLDNSETHQVAVGFVTVVHPDKCSDDADPDLRLSTVCSLVGGGGGGDDNTDPTTHMLTGGLVITQGMQIALLNAATPKYITYSYVGFFRQWILKHDPQVAFHSWIHDYDYGSERDEITRMSLEMCLRPPVTLVSALLLLHAFVVLFL